MAVGTFDREADEALERPEGSAPPLATRLSGLSVVAAWIVILAGTAVLAGWAFDVPILKSLHAGLVPMKANAAAGLVLAGTALCLAGARRGWQQQTGRVSAIAVASLGLVTLGEDLFGWDPHIDQLMFREAANAVGTAHAGRMSPVTALDLMLLGVALALISRDSALRIAQLIALVASWTAMIALLGYVFGVHQLYGLFSYTQIALPTTLALLVLGVGVLCARPQGGFMPVVVSPGTGGRLARRLLPWAIVFPIALGSLRLFGQRAGLYGTEFGLSLMVAAMVSTLALLIWSTAVSLDRAERQRQEVERALQRKTLLDATQAIMQVIVETANEAFVSIDADGRVVAWNAKATESFGWSPDEILGRSLAEAIIPARDRAGHLRGMRQARDTGEGPLLGRRVELLALHKDGHEFPVEVTVSALRWGDSYLFNAFLHDITERRRTEEALQQSESRFRLLAENARDIVYRYGLHPTRGFEYVSAACTFITGYTPEEHYADPDLGFKMVHADDRALLEGIAQAPDAAGHAVQLRWLRKDGRVIWTEQSNHLVPDAEGRIVAIEGIARDITERKVLEQERENLIGQLQAALQQVRSLSELLPICSNCRKIKDEADGSWSVLELYLSKKNLGTLVTHGICPECTRELYPGIVRRQEAKGQDQ